MSGFAIEVADVENGLSVLVRALDETGELAPVITVRCEENRSGRVVAVTDERGRRRDTAWTEILMKPGEQIP